MRLWPVHIGQVIETTTNVVELDAFRRRNQPTIAKRVGQAAMRVFQTHETSSQSPDAVSVAPVSARSSALKLLLTPPELYEAPAADQPAPVTELRLEYYHGEA